MRNGVITRLILLLMILILLLILCEDGAEWKDQE